MTIAAADSVPATLRQAVDTPGRALVGSPCATAGAAGRSLFRSTTTGYGASGNSTAAPSVGSSVAYNGAEQMTGRTASGSTAGCTDAGTDQVELIAQSGGRDHTYGRTNAAGVPIIESHRNGSTPTTAYTCDPQGTPPAVAGANSHHLALDGLGSPVALVSNCGGQIGAYSLGLVVPARVSTSVEPSPLVRRSAALVE